MADLDSAAQVLAEPSRYSLTPIAGELSESFVTLAAWAERHRHAIAASRRKYDGPLGRHTGD
jgi:DNA-binding HxlR family transcriptional regulator